MKDRILELDITKFVAIFLVLVGHAILHLSSSNSYDNSLYVFISSFHMPLFMLIAGFFSSSSLNLSFKKLVQKKFLQLIYPCLTFGLLFFFVSLCINGFSLNSLFEMFVPGFWFLKSCFLCYVITYLALKFIKNKYLAVLICLLASQLIPTYKINWMLPFFILGYLLSGNFQHLQKYKYQIFAISLIIFSIALYNADIFESNLLQNLKHELLSGNITVIYRLPYIQSMRFLLGLSGSMLIISAIMIVCSLFPSIANIKRMNLYGRETLGIYIVQTLILETVLSKYIDLKEVNIYVFSFLICPLISLVVLEICYSIYSFCRHYSWSDKFLLGNFKIGREI